MKKGTSSARYSTCSAKGREDFSLGMAVLQASRPPGYRCTLDEIAAYTGLTRGGVWMAEQAAIRKLRRKIRELGEHPLRELAEQAGLRGKP